MSENAEVARASDLGLALRASRDIASVLGASLRHGGLVVTESELSPEFFDLRSGFAGEVFQRLANYRARLAIVVEESNSHGARFGELIHEHRNHALVRFFTTESEAMSWLQNGRSE